MEEHNDPAGPPRRSSARRAAKRSASPRRPPGPAAKLGDARISTRTRGASAAPSSVARRSCQAARHLLVLPTPGGPTRQASPRVALGQHVEGALDLLSSRSTTTSSFPSAAATVRFWPIAVQVREPGARSSVEARGLDRARSRTPARVWRARPRLEPAAARRRGAWRPADDGGVTRVRRLGDGGMIGTGDARARLGAARGSRGHGRGRPRGLARRRPRGGDAPRTRGIAGAPPRRAPRPWRRCAGARGRRRR